MCPDGKYRNRHNEADKNEHVSWAGSPHEKWVSPHLCVRQCSLAGEGIKPASPVRNTSVRDPTRPTLPVWRPHSSGGCWGPFPSPAAFEEPGVHDKPESICIAIQPLTDSWSQGTVNLIVLLTAPGCETHQRHSHKGIKNQTRGKKKKSS